MECVEDSIQIVFILIKSDWRFLFVGVVVAFGNNFQVVDNSLELKNNVKDKHLLINEM